jgi:hypothetical protein
MPQSSNLPFLAGDVEFQIGMRSKYSGLRGKKIPAEVNGIELAVRQMIGSYAQTQILFYGPRATTAYICSTVLTVLFPRGSGKRSQK